MFNEKISIAKGFQTSVNIAFDLYNDEKIENFIPTIASIELLEEITYSIVQNDAARARFLTGAYGRGKSHIILVLLSLLFKKNKEEIFRNLLGKINDIKPLLYDYIFEYLQSEKKLLPIIVSGSSTNLTQSFLSAMQQALSREELIDIMPDTNFKAAINMIELWKNEYGSTYTKFVESLNEPIGNYILALKEFDVEAYNSFLGIYPKLTSGSEFNPFAGVNVIELYEEVVDKLKKARPEYLGIFIVYDEFSKYLESSMTHATISDTKLLQDLAEKCNRSGDKQMHLMLISHKDIANYIDNSLSKEKVDGWRGVSGRFEHVTLRNNFSQIYEIISAVIKKDGRFWGAFLETNQVRFEDLQDRFAKEGIIESDVMEIAIKGCYPLHPITTFILPRLSEKIAQNERTLFTFLSSNTQNTLRSFLQMTDTEFPLLTPDYLYDYFEPLLRKEHYISQTYKTYRLAERVLEKVDVGSLHAKIVKTIALIYIVEQFEKLAPTIETIINIFIDAENQINSVENAIANLMKKDCIIYLKRSNGYLKIKESSGIDVYEELTNTIEKTKTTANITEILNKTSFENYMYPTSYNDENEIVRYFDFAFIDDKTFFNTENWKADIKQRKSDGVVYAIIPKNDEQIAEIKNKLITNKFGHERMLFVVPNKYFDITKIVLEYNAALMLRELAIGDDLLFDEYDIIVEDLEEVISNFIFSYTRPENKKVEYYHNSQKQNFKRKAQISVKLSEICKKTFTKAPIINNEVINKNEISAVAINSRNRLIAGLLEDELDINLGLSGTGQEVSIMRSTLIQTGILIDLQTHPTLNLDPKDSNIRNVLNIIYTYLGNAVDGEKSFKNLYDVLVLPEHGIGLRKGVIPIFVAVALHKLKKHIVIRYKFTEMKITVDLLNAINQKPEEYTVMLESWNEEKAEYINRLKELFFNYTIEKEKDYNIFSYIFFAMNRWYIGLPRYVKEITSLYVRGKNENAERAIISTSHIKFLNSFRQQNVNARDYLLEKLFEIYGYKEVTSNIVNDISNAKTIFDGALENLINELGEDIKTIFNKTNDKNSTLTAIVNDWYERLSEKSKKHLYTGNEDKILQLMGDIDNDEKAFIKKLAKLIMGLRIEDWHSKTVNEFLDKLIQFKKTILEFDRNVANNHLNTKGVYRLTFIDELGKESTKTFTKDSYSERAKLLFNSICSEIDDMGQSITEQEKRQVLMEILEKMC